MERDKARIQCTSEGRSSSQVYKLHEALKKLKEMDPNIDDQNLPPFAIVGIDGKPVGPIVDNDDVVSFNFRADWMVMAGKAFDLEIFESSTEGRCQRSGMLVCSSMMLISSFQNIILSPLPKLIKHPGSIWCTVVSEHGPACD